MAHQETIYEARIKSLEVAQWREFHITQAMRERYGFKKILFSTTGNVILCDHLSVRDFCATVNKHKSEEKKYQPGEVNAMGLIDELTHLLIRLYRQSHPTLWAEVASSINATVGAGTVMQAIRLFVACFPPSLVFNGEMTAESYLHYDFAGELGWEVELEEFFTVKIAQRNPAFNPYAELFDDSYVEYSAIETHLMNYFSRPSLGNFMGGEGGVKDLGVVFTSVLDFIEEPRLRYPHSLYDQLEYIRQHWPLELMGDNLQRRLLTGMTFIAEQRLATGWWGHGKAEYMGFEGGKGYYQKTLSQHEAFTQDRQWMPNVVMIAKNALVWLEQLSQQYGYHVQYLSDIPDATLDELAHRGFNSLWLIGLWERSFASKRMKNLMGNHSAEGSAYSLDCNEIAQRLGGWLALNNLRDRATQRGIQLASDMVPNHTAMDSTWVRDFPDYFMQRDNLPYDYHFTHENLSNKPEMGVYMEDGYFTKSDAAVVFKQVDHRSGRVRYVYHGNDGTNMPWNDTAQINFLHPSAREAVIQEIVRLAKVFPILRLDAAMVLVKKHIQRLWYPLPGTTDSIASRSDYAMSNEEFDRAMPVEFWREVVDRVAQEAGQTLLIAEAFWMLESYFTRTLGMHRVYNSAFMHMLMKEQNGEYRQFIRETQEFDLEILKRFVNFMSNPDEETALEQFGDGDKYFGVATMLATLPGLPMFAHGQVDGLGEKYGMEFSRALHHESSKMWMVERHMREIAPLLYRRRCFSEAQTFRMYDFISTLGVNQNVFAYSNRYEQEAVLVIYNNSYEASTGWISMSVPFKGMTGGGKVLATQSLADAWHLHNEDGYYVVFQEQRSDKWFLRRSQDLFNQGLMIIVNGYQAQVFWNVYEIFDTDGTHAIMYDENGQNGMINRPLNKAQQTIEDAVTALCEHLRSCPLEAFRDSYYQKADGKRALFAQEFYIHYLVKHYPELTDTELKKQLTHIQDLYITLGTLADKLSEGSKEVIEKEESYLAFMGCYTLLLSYHLAGFSEKVLHHGRVQHELEEIWRANGLTDWSFFNEVITFFERRDLSSFYSNTNVAFIELWADEDWLKMCGVNKQETVFWFNKEQTMKATTLLFIILHVDYPKKGGKAKHFKQLRDSYEKWQESYASSGYQITILLSLLKNG
jgi:glycosidase